MLPKHEKEMERMNLGGKKFFFSVSYNVYISNGWKIILDKTMNFFYPYKNTVIVVKLPFKYYSQPCFTARYIHLS